MTVTAKSACSHAAPKAFSALVAAWNEADMIERHVTSFLALPWRDCELILHAGGDDDTYERAIAAAGSSSRVRVLQQRRGQGKQAALRESLPYARFPWIYLTDADCLFEIATLEPLMQAAADGYAAVTGGSTPLPEQLGRPLVAYQASRDAWYYDRLGPMATGVLGRNALISRDVIDRAGGFGTPVATGTDYHLTMQLKRLGVVIAHAKDSRVASGYPDTWHAYVRMWRRWIKNLVVHDAVRNARSVATSGVLAAVLVAAPLAAVALRSWSLTMVSLVLWGVAVATRARQLLLWSPGDGVSQRRHLAWLPLFALLDQLAVLLALTDSLTPRGRSKW